MKNEVLNTPFFSTTMRQDGIVCITWISTVEVTLSVLEVLGIEHADLFGAHL